MSFELICPGCGAESGASVGVCPFCKSILTIQGDQNHQQKNSVAKMYENGRLDIALSLAKKLYQTDEKFKKDPAFLLLYVKILIETEGPSSHIKSILAEAYLSAPSQQDILDYMELMEARDHLKKGLNDTGEVQIRNLLRRSPQNVHAHFLLGTHLFWQGEEASIAIPHLETCVRLSPNFLRAWGCLGAIYKKMGHAQLASKAFLKCADLETSPTIREFFQKQALE